MDNGEFEEVEVDDVDEGDILLVKTGAKSSSGWHSPYGRRAYQ